MKPTIADRDKFKQKKMNMDEVRASQAKAQNVLRKMDGLSKKASGSKLPKIDFKSTAIPKSVLAYKQKSEVLENDPMTLWKDRKYKGHNY